MARPVRRWWESFFGPDYLKQYEHTLARTGEEVDGIEKILHLGKGSRILDLACGAGRHSIELAKRGYAVTGFDYSEDLLHRARADAKRAKARATFVRGDMRDLRFRGAFDAVINMFSSFGYFDTVREDRKVLEGVAHALKPRGKFLMERFNRESLAYELPLQGWRVGEDGSVVLQEDTFDVLLGRYDTRQIVIDREGTREHRGSVRAYTLPELKELFDAAGLPIHRVLGGLDLSAYRARSRRLVLYAVKGLEPESIRTMW
ncbi:MAG TPA: methyltransferase domain-containing protein [Thermoplasmata archaeon]|nr:methyltransferase domain-containing protein [Thermoplasmata archaeon]